MLQQVLQLLNIYLTCPHKLLIYLISWGRVGTHTPVWNSRSVQPFALPRLPFTASLQAVDLLSAERYNLIDHWN
jgi:hypothetical protein